VPYSDELDQTLWLSSRPTGNAIWRTSSKHNVVLHSGPLASRYENMTSSTKPEVHNVSQRRQRKTESRSQATCVKIGEVQRMVFNLSERTYKQTDILITIHRTHPGAN